MGPQLVPVEPFLRWDADVSRRFLSSVKRVEILESRERGGVTFYVVDVFLTLPETRLPVASAAVTGPALATSETEPEPEAASIAAQDASPATAERAPTYQIERRYSAFRRLRETLEEWVHESIPLCRCAFCVELVEHLRFSWSQPSPLSKLVHAACSTRKKMLETFVNDMVAFGRRPQTPSASALSARRPSTRRTQCCTAQAHMPSLLEAFLLDKSHQ